MSIYNKKVIHDFNNQAKREKKANKVLDWAIQVVNGKVSLVTLLLDKDGKAITYHTIL